MVSDRVSDSRPIFYSGQDASRVKQLGTAHSTTVLGTDQSGTKTYAFNSLGYRGPEFDPDAGFRVFVFGESYAFGMGLDLEECWASRLVDLLTEQRGIDRQDVCVMNFAEGGASNTGIARNVLAHAW